MRGPKTNLILSRFTDALDGRGTQTRSWSDLRFITGTLQTLSANEMIVYSKFTDVVSHKFTYQSFNGETVTTKDKLREGTKSFDIKSIISNPGRGGWDVLILKEFNT